MVSFVFHGPTVAWLQVDVVCFPCFLLGVVCFFRDHDGVVLRWCGFFSCFHLGVVCFFRAPDGVVLRWCGLFLVFPFGCGLFFADFFIHKNCNLIITSTLKVCLSFFLLLL